MCDSSDSEITQTRKNNDLAFFFKLRINIMKFGDPGMYGPKDDDGIKQCRLKDRWTFSSPLHMLDTDQTKGAVRSGFIVFVFMIKSSMK